MAPERMVLCGGLSAGRAAADPDPVLLRRWPPDPNVNVVIEDVQRAVYHDLPPRFLDLIDLAAYVYAADQAVTRGGDGVEDCGGRWRRNLVFRVPVREPDFWRTGPVRDALVSTLSFLSEDEYRFEFEPLADRGSLQQLMQFGGTAFDGVVEDVAMFSGGLDSLAGAVRESVLGRRKVLLVNHRSNEKVTPRHRDLVRRLCARAGSAAPLHVRVRVNKQKDLGRGHTQRTRSFLFAALGVTFAAMIGRDRLGFYENGVVSLNLPLSAQVVGARASRTTHPRVLAGLSGLAGALTGKSFAVENPFLWLTKADVVRVIADAGCGDLIGRSTSCGHTWEQTSEHPHCGKCSQCIDRRFAVLAAGRGDNDPAAGYVVQLLTDPLPEGRDRAVLAAYLETANQAGRMTDLEFFGRFGGEVSRAIRSIPGEPDAVGRQVVELYRRHASEVNRVLSEAIRGNADALRDRTLPADCLVGLVIDQGTPPAESPPAGELLAPAGVEYLFQRRGQVWLVRFAGGPVNILLPSKGAAYLHILLSRPDTGIPAVDLAYQVLRQRQVYALGDAGEQLPREVVVAYRARLAEYREEEEKAQRDNDPGRLARVQADIEYVLNELRAAAGAGGQLRRVADDRERVRKAVGIAIRRTIKEIADFDRPFADHLGQRLQCGRSPRYMVDRGVRWET